VPKTRSEKEVILQELKEKLESAKSVVLTDYRGLTVAEVTRLRRSLREAGCEFRVAKNTLTALAARQIGMDGLDPYLEGPISIAISASDPVAPAKILTEFIRETKKMEIRAGVLEGRIISADGVKGLADLPAREVLLAKVLGGMQSPLYGFANVLQGTIRRFVYALEAVREQRAGEEA